MDLILSLDLKFSQRVAAHLERVDLPVGAAWKLETHTLMPTMAHPGVAFAHFFNCKQAHEVMGAFLPGGRAEPCTLRLIQNGGVLGTFQGKAFPSALHKKEDCPCGQLTSHSLRILLK